MFVLDDSGDETHVMGFIGADRFREEQFFSCAMVAGRERHNKARTKTW